MDDMLISVATVLLVGNFVLMLSPLLHLSEVVVVLARIGAGVRLDQIAELRATLRCFLTRLAQLCIRFTGHL